MVGKLFRREAETAAARPLYARIVEAARRPGFYRDLGVPDTIDGRFEMIALHLFLVLHRLKRPGPAPAVEDGGPDAAALSQALLDTAFADLDASLREMGAGDLGVGRRVKQMATGFYGRVAAYEAGLAGTADLEAAIRRNLYGTVEPTPGRVAAMARYLRAAAARLDGQAAAALRAGRAEFAPLDDPPLASQAMAVGGHREH